MKIVGLTQGQYDRLLTDGSVTANGKTVNFDPHDMYLTPDAHVDSAFLCKHLISMVISGVAYSFTIQNYRSKPYTNAKQLDEHNENMLNMTMALKESAGGTKQSIMITQTVYNSSTNEFAIIYDNDQIARANCNNIQIMDTVKNLGIVTLDTDKIAGIIESGGSDSSSWTKFADGTMICCGSSTQTRTLTTWSGTLADNRIENIAFPIAFTTIPYVSAYSVSGGYSAMIGSTQITKNNFNCCIIRGVEDANHSYIYTIQYIAIGRWK